MPRRNDNLPTGRTPGEEYMRSAGLTWTQIERATGYRCGGIAKIFRYGTPNGVTAWGLAKALNAALARRGLGAIDMMALMHPGRLMGTGAALPRPDGAPTPSGHVADPPHHAGP